VVFRPHPLFSICCTDFEPRMQSRSDFMPICAGQPNTSLRPLAQIWVRKSRHQL
jgi:hypothetical protein